MKRSTAAKKLTFDAPKRQKKDPMMSTKKASLCAYEQVRMETMQSNAEIMKERGNNTIANILLRKLASVEDDESNIVSESRKVNDVPPKQPNEPPKVSNNVNSSSSKKGKQQLVQTLPMAEFLASQSRDGQSKNSKSQQNQLPLLVKETQRNKALADKKQHYCAPGSISRYLQVIMSHGPKGQQSNDLNSHDTNVDLTLADESLRPQPQVNVSDEFEVSEDASQNQNHEANVPEAFQNESNESSVTKENKHRGRTILAHVHARIMEKRPPDLFNNLNQPVGPDKDILRDFSHLLGTLAKDSSFAPLNYVTWKYMHSSFKKKNLGLCPEKIHS